MEELMFDWFKDRWELALAGLIGIVAFFLGRRNTKATEASLDSAEKQLEITEKINKEEADKKAAAIDKYVRETERLREEHKEAKSELERETAQRKIELLEKSKEDPDAIDKILEKEFNIARLK